jgi:hypothetical protein
VRARIALSGWLYRGFNPSSCPSPYGRRDARIAAAGETASPLPEGEGQGEGLHPQRNPPLSVVQALMLLRRCGKEAATHREVHIEYILRGRLTIVNARMVNPGSGCAKHAHFPRILLFLPRFLRFKNPVKYTGIFEINHNAHRAAPSSGWRAVNKADIQQ